MIENIVHNERILAIIVRANFQPKGINFLTPDDYSLQLAYMNRPEGYVIQPHIHQLVDRNTQLTQEVLLIRKGKVRVDFYEENKNYLTSRILEEGDVVLLAAGGHGFEALESVEIIEVKQGPYVKEMDKVRFEPVSRESLNFEGDEK